MWANSQAVSLRRMKFNDGMVLSDGEGWSSGGFMADCYSNGTVSSGSQQQYLTRNDFWRLWDGGVWNMVFVGIDTVRTPAGTMAVFAIYKSADYTCYSGKAIPYI